MKKLTLIIFLAILTISVAMAGAIPQAPQSPNDILGAHLLYGRGCIGCHAPHSGSAGNGVRNGDATNGNYALWGQDLTPLYGKTITFGDAGAYSVTLPAAGTITSAHDANTIILFCLSCHDGNLAKVGMMKGVTVETLPVVGGTAPTLLGADGSTAGNYNNDHPVGGSAVVTCGGYSWDCTGGNTTAIIPSANQIAFIANYGFPVASGSNTAGYKLASFGSTVTAVTCTTCHDQHSMTVYSGTIGGAKGFYATMFFVKGFYNPTTGGNSAAQFCRQCHGGESNEAHGVMNVPTT
jgi:cytochrome c551/c552